MDPVGTLHSNTPQPPPPPAQQFTGSRVLGGIWEATLTRLTNSTHVASEFLRHHFGSPLTVVVAGETGLGKSTLINQVFGFDMARAGAGRPVTNKARLYADEHIRIVDTVGFIRGLDEGAQRFDGDLLLRLVDPTHRDTVGKLVIDIDGNDVDNL
ncbi:hypothetical protein HK405_007628, partial [Cladochytrium tenue]